MRPKAKTLIERLGFDDPDRKDPIHDDIQIWTLKNYKIVIKSLGLGHSTDEFEYFEPTSGPALEYPIVQCSTTGYKNIIGFVDLVQEVPYRGTAIKDEYSRYMSSHRFAFEIKTKIPSCGELIRQINFYRGFLPASWIVVSPDDRYADVLRQQNIYFYKYQDPTKLF